MLNRPWAVVQWLRLAKIPERYVLMSEPDHLWLKPMPNLMIGEKPASFPFFYIEPSKASNAPLVQKFTGKLSRQQLESISPIGEAFLWQFWGGEGHAKHAGGRTAAPLALLPCLCRGRGGLGGWGSVKDVVRGGLTVTKIGEAVGGWNGRESRAQVQRLCARRGRHLPADAIGITAIVNWRARSRHGFRKCVNCPWKLG